MSMFNYISWGSKDNKIECASDAQLVSLFARRFGARQWSFIGPGSEKEWYSICADSPQGEWDKIAELMMLTFAESGHPVFRATSPLSRGQLRSKGDGILSIHFCADGDTVETVFRTVISVNQLSLYGAVAEMCSEYESFMIERGDPVWEDSRVPRSCQVWSRQTRLWVLMSVLTKIFYCKDTENELKSYHNKTD